MSYSEDQLWDLLEQAYGMPYGAGQIALVEQVVAHADALHLAQLAFAARMQATTSYVYGGEPARAVVSFTWCLAEFDREPVSYQRHQRNLLWHFKYMVVALTKFPDVSLERTYAVLDDMERRWRESGHSMHAVHAHRHYVARHIGDVAAAERYYAQWGAAPRDHLSNCVGCDPSSKAWWLASRGRDEEAVALAEPVLAGTLTCSEQPQAILTTLMLPYLRTGRLDQARDAHRRAYRLHRPNLADLGDIGDHIEFCARTGNEARGVEILERHLGWLDRAPSPYAAMTFAAAGSLVLRRAAANVPDDVTVMRPAHGEREAARVSAAVLGPELASVAGEIAARFDRRNGTDEVGTMVRQTLAAEPLVDYLPLSPTAPHRPVSTAAASPPPPSAPSTAGGSPPDLGTTAPTVAPTTEPFTVPDTAGPGELLDLIDGYYDDDRDAEAAAALDAFDARYHDRELPVELRARLVDARGVRLAADGDLAGAVELWRAAAQDFAAVSDCEGEDRVTARIGAVLVSTGNADEGLPMVIAATERLLSSANPRTRLGAAIRLAACYLKTQDQESALATLDRVTAGPAEAPLHTRASYASMRLVTLALLGRLDEVRQAAPETIELTESAGLADEAAQAHFALAGGLEAAGDYSAAADHLAAGAAVFSDDAKRSAARTLRATLLAKTDRAAEALDDLVEAVAAETAVGDAESAADHRHALATAYLNMNRFLDAAEVAEEELAYRLRADASVAAEAVPSTAIPVRHLLSTIYQRMNQPDEAIAQLDAIAADCARTGNRAGVGQMAQEAGQILDRLNRDDAAAARYLVAADAYAEVHRDVDELRNRRRHAMSLHWAHGADRAVPALATVDELSARIADDSPAADWERSWLDYDAARILWGAERFGEAAARADSAAERLRRLDRPSDARTADLLRAHILLGGGKPAEAEAAIRRVLDDEPDRSGLDSFVGVLAAALQAQGREDAAKACWSEYGLPVPPPHSHPH
jgi:cellulose synthase operon protein C